MIVTIGLLVGRVIQGFENVLSRAFPFFSASTVSFDLDGSSEQAQISPSSTSSALSWGSLHIEPDEEHEIKSHLLLMQFRKLERVLEQLGSSVRQLRSAQDSSTQGSSNNSSHLMACQGIHMWLAQKANSVKDRYFAFNQLNYS